MRQLHVLTLFAAALCLPQVAPAEELIATCPSLHSEALGPLTDSFLERNLYHGFGGDTEARNAWFEEQEARGEPFESGRLTVSFYRVQIYDVPAIRVEFFNVDEDIVSQSSIHFPHRVEPGFYEVRDYILIPATSQALTAWRLHAESDHELPTSMQQQLIELSTDDWSEEQMESFRFEPADRLQYIGDCEFHDDLRWVE